jgi:RNA polymerase sigma-70 factor (ECF subfamily)
MDSDAPFLDPELILANQGFLQRLARGIVGDDSAADDVVQQTWLAAIERPPRSRASMRGWLARVVRNTATNRARSEVRRADHERRFASEEAHNADDSMELRLEVQRRVVEAVQRLDEPYKRAIYLRYHEDRSPRDIAEQSMLPEATVKTHLRRGLALLRGDLDRALGDDRRTWLTALAAIGRLDAPAPLPSTSQASPTTAAGFGASSKLGAVAVLAASALIFFWQPWRSSAIDASRSPIANEARSTLDESSSSLAAAGAAPTRSSDANARQVVAEPAVARSRPVELTIHGRVVDPRRFPVASAAITLYLPDVESVSTKSNDRGEFMIELDKLPSVRSWRGGIRAVDRDGRTAVCMCDVSSARDRERWSRGYLTAVTNPKERDVGVLVLDAPHVVRARVADAGRSVADVRVIAAWDSRRIPIAEARSDSSGLVVFESLPTGKVFLRAIAKGKAGSAWTFASDLDARVVDLELADTRSIDVHVADAATGQGVADAEVWVAEDIVLDTSLGDAMQPAMNAHTFQNVELPITRVGADGRCRIDDVPATGGMMVNASADGYSSDRFQRGTGEWIRAGATSVEIKLKRERMRTVRWPIERGDTDVPADGSSVRVRRATISSFGDDATAPESGRIEKGELVIDGFTSALSQVTVESADGSTARAWAGSDSDHGKPIRFQRTHKLEVCVRDDRGQPVANARAQAFNQGNNLLVEAVPTNEQGCAVLTGITGQLVMVRVLAPDDAGMGDLAGSVDLDKGDGKVEFTLPRKLELCFRFTLAGRPLLPSRFAVRGMNRGYKVVREDPEQGLAFVSVSAPSDKHELELNVRSTGYATVIKRVAFQEEPPPRPIDVELEPAAAIVVRLDASAKQDVELYAEEWNAEQSKWKSASFYGVRSPNGAGGTYRFDDCAAGRYRVREKLSDVVSPEFDVAPGACEVPITLDLARVRTVSGIVEFPPDVRRESVRVIVDGAARDEPTWLRGGDTYPGTPIDASGAFTLKLPGARPERIRAWHPFLVPARDQGSAEITAGRDDLRLRLVHGDEIRIPVPAPLLERKLERLRVMQFAGEPTGKPVAWFHAPIEDGIARFSGIAPGTWTLWIDPQDGWAPIVLRDVEVSAGIMTLPQLSLEVGSSLRVHVLVKAGQSAPHIYVAAKRRGEPSYMRSINSRGEDVVVLAGFGTGAFDVTLHGAIGEGPGSTRIVELDGVHDADLDLDLR